MSSTTPLLSIIMPIHNGEAYLQHALDSLTQQDIPQNSFEVIALNDASSDRSNEILQSYSSRLPLRILPGAGCRNWVATTNLGLNAARGTYLSFLHQDDLYAPQRLRLLTSLPAFTSASARIFIHPVHYISSKGSRLGLWAPPFPKGLLSPAQTLPRLLLQNNIAVPGVLFHRDCLSHYGLLDESLRYTADWDYWLRLLAHEPCVYVPRPLAAFRIHAASQTVAFAAHQHEYADNLRIVVQRFAPLVPPRTQKLAALGTDINLLLAAAGTHVRPLPWRPVLKHLLSLSPLDTLHYFHIANVFPRVIARLRAPS